MEEEIKDYFIRQCRYCNKTFEFNHGNRFFCDPKTLDNGARNCKVTYNNMKAKKRRDLTKDFDHSAYLNWEILDCFRQQNKSIVSGEELLSSKFKAAFFTGLIIDPETKVQIPIYYSYTLSNLGGNQFKISKI